LQRFRVVDLKKPTKILNFLIFILLAFHILSFSLFLLYIFVAFSVSSNNTPTVVQWSELTGQLTIQKKQEIFIKIITPSSHVNLKKNAIVTCLLIWVLIQKVSEQKLLHAKRDNKTIVINNIHVCKMSNIAQKFK